MAVDLSSRSCALLCRETLKKREIPVKCPNFVQNEWAFKKWSATKYHFRWAVKNCARATHQF
jgi:hypothetical protein